VDYARETLPIRTPLPVLLFRGTEIRNILLLFEKQCWDSLRSIGGGPKNEMFISCVPIEYNPEKKAPLNDKILKDKRKELRETLDPVMKLYVSLVELMILTGFKLHNFSNSGFFLSPWHEV
jgi:hypothetical protein